MHMLAFIPFLLCLQFILLPKSINGQAPITSLAPNIPMGIFLAYDPAQSNYYIPITKKYLDYICANHRNPAGPYQYIGDMVIQTLAVVDNSVNNFANPLPPANDALIWEFLEPLLPYFPGGSGPCRFDRVYVGTIGLDHGKDTNGNWILDALTDTNWRTNYLTRQKAVAQKFADKVRLSANPNVKWEWYILPEMCMDYVHFDQYNSGTQPKYADVWGDYVSRHMADLNSILPGRQFLWSPMFDNVPEYYDPGSITYIQNSLKGMLNKIASNLAASMPTACSTALNCPLAVAPQDHVGLGSISSAKNYTKEDALYWMNLLKPVFPFKNLTINVEQFIRNTWPHANTWPVVGDDTYNDADCIEVKLREQFYVANGFSLGPAWAINAWYSCNHPGVPICASGWTEFNQNCYKKFHTGAQWKTANATCVNNGAQLVSIHSKQENDFIVALDRDPATESSIWTGYFDPFLYTHKKWPEQPSFIGTANGTVIFRWSDNMFTDYLNWTPGWPNSAYSTACSTCGQNCVAIYPANGGGQWANAGCDWYAGAFVCKKDAFMSETDIYIRANANNKIVSAWNSGADPLQAVVTAAYGWEKFRIVKNSDGSVSFRSMINGKFVSVDLNFGAKLIANKDVANTGERFNLIDMGDGTVALKALANNKFVCADLSQTNAPLIANKDAVYTWERFVLVNY